jgi:hypothetical protein
MQDKLLVKVTVVTDTETGDHIVGELDFGVPATTPDWLDAQPSRAKVLADWMRWLADRCEARESPFSSFAQVVQP